MSFNQPKESVREFLDRLYRFRWLAPQGLPPIEYIGQAVTRHAGNLAAVGWGWGCAPPGVMLVSYEEAVKRRTGEAYAFHRRNYENWTADLARGFRIPEERLLRAYQLGFHSAQDAVLSARPRIGQFALTLALHLAGLCTAGQARDLAAHEAIREQLENLGAPLEYKGLINTMAYDTVMELWEQGLMPVGDDEHDYFLVAVPPRLVPDGPILVCKPSNPYDSEQ